MVEGAVWEGQQESKISGMYSHTLHAAFPILYNYMRRYLALFRYLLPSLPRYGKYAVLDLLDVDVWEATVQLFDNVQAGLMESLLDKTILQKEK